MKITGWLGQGTVLSIAGTFAAVLVSACSSSGSMEDDYVALDSVQQSLAVRGKHLWGPAQSQIKTKIPVCWLNGTTEQKNAVKKVVAEGWEAVADEQGDDRYGVDFTGWQTCPADPKGKFISIKFNPDLEDFSGIVHGGLGRGALNENPSMELKTTSKRTVLHEFGHVLSFSHEFVRSDYDEVDEDCEHTNGTDPDVGITEVDTSSIMNYTDCGAGSDLSDQDVLAFQRLFGPFSLSYSNKGAVNAVALRSPVTSASGLSRFVRGAATPTNAEGLPASAQLHFVSVSSPTSTSLVKFGDKVRILTPTGYLYSAGTNAAPEVKTKTTVDSKSVFVIAGGTTGEELGVNDAVDLIHSDSGRHLVPSGNELRVQSAAAGTWTFISLGAAVAL